jgi:hypothetical protein
MFVHPAIFYATFAKAPNSQQHEWKSTTMAYPSAHKDMLTLDINPNDILWQRREFV